MNTKTLFCVLCCTALMACEQETQPGNAGETTADTSRAAETAPEAEATVATPKDALASARKSAAEGDIDAAITTLTSATKTEANAELLNELGFLEYKAEKYDAATKHLEQALEADPGDDLASKIQYNMGLVAAKQGDDETARSRFQSALSSLEMAKPKPSSYDTRKRVIQGELSSGCPEVAEVLERVEATITGEGKEATVKLGSETFKVAWRGNLDADKVEDLVVVSTDKSGASGARKHVALIGCKSDFAKAGEVWGISVQPADELYEGQSIKELIAMDNESGKPVEIRHSFSTPKKGYVAQSRK